MSNAAQTGQFFNVDALARMADASVVVVDEILRPDIDVLFPAMVVLGVKGNPKPYDGLKGRTVYVWVIDPDPKLDSIAAIAHMVQVVRGTQSPAAFLGNPGRVREYVRSNLEPVRKAEPIVEPERVEAVAQPIEITDVDEQSLAEAFSSRNPHLRYVSAWNRWFEWNGHQWRHDETLRVFDLARAVCKDSAPITESAPLKRKIKSAATRAAVVNLAQSDRRHAATVDQWDKDVWMLNTPAGMIDLRRGVVRDSRIDDYATKSTAIGPAGDCPQWREFVRQICDFDDELAAFLQRMIGYSLTGSVREQCLFFCYGTGANGKGTFINTIRDILADYATVAGMDVFTESKHDRHPQELARLRGARMVCAQETDQGKLWAEARIKALTGGDPITAHFMRQDDFEFMPQFKLVIAGNHKPMLRNIDEAMRRRLHLVPFTVTIPPDKRDSELAAKLRVEAPGILQWAIDGCVAWQKDGLKPPDAVRAATPEYLNSQDMFGEWIEECTERVTAEKTKTSDMYRNYRSWSEARGDHPFAQKRFKEMMESRNYKISKINGIPFVWFVKVKNSHDINENAVEF